MSLIDVLLARKEILLSFVVVGLVMLAAVILVVAPAMIKTGKQSMAKRKARQAAKLARKSKIARDKRTARARSAPKPRPVPVAAIETLPESPERQAAASEPSDQPVRTTPVVTLSTESFQPDLASPESVLEGPAGDTTDTETPDETKEDSTLQSILDSVFTNDEMHARYDTLLRSFEVDTAETILTTAKQVVAELRAWRGYHAAERRQ